MPVIVTTPDQARRFLDDVKHVADPIARGDNPYEFTILQLRTAFDKAVAVYHYAFGLLKDSDDSAMTRGSELLTAGRDANTIAEEILRKHNPKPALKRRIEEDRHRVNVKRAAMAAKTDTGVRRSTRTSR